MDIWLLCVLVNAHILLLCVLVNGHVVVMFVLVNGHIKYCMCVGEWRYVCTLCVCDGHLEV